MSVAEAPAPPVIISMNERERHIQRHAHIDESTLPKEVGEPGGLDPLIPGCSRTVTYKDGTTKEFPASICYLNHGNLHYAWLTDETQASNSMWAGYVQVRQDNKYSVVQDGSGKRIPDHYFTNGVIYHGNLGFYACEWPYYQSIEKRVKAVRDKRIATFERGKKMPGDFDAADGLPAEAQGLRAMATPTTTDEHGNDGSDGEIARALRNRSRK